MREISRKKLGGIGELMVSRLEKNKFKLPPGLARHQHSFIARLTHGRIVSK